MLVFLTPAGFAVALAAALPLAALALAARRVSAVRRALRLPPGAPERQSAALALAAVAALVAVAAAQPALRSNRVRHVRTDAAALVVVDVSRSMLAAPKAGAPTRFDRARTAAVRLRAALPDVRVGLAALTDRVLPDLFPSADEAAFDGVVRRALGIEQPPPVTDAVRATDFGALTSIPALGYFEPGASRRLVILLTDGESKPFRPDRIARAFAVPPGIRLVVVRFGSAGEAIFESGGLAEAGYRPDPAAAQSAADLASAAGGQAFSEHRLGPAATAARSALGAGPTAAHGVERRTLSLGRYAALAALAPLGFVLWRRNLG